jgi:hypothetical protein
LKFPTISATSLIICILFSLLSIASLIFTAITSSDSKTIYIALIIIIFLLAFLYSYYRELSREQADKRAELFKSLTGYLDEEKIKSIMDTFFKLMTKNVREGRANIMLIEQEGATPVLKIKYYYRMKGSPDLNCTWEKREGCCGLAWSTGKPKLLDLSNYATEKDRDDALKNELGIRSQNIACTGRLLSILSVPLFDAGDNDKIIGVINCDSRLSAVDSGLKTLDTSLYLITIGKIISHVLKIRSILKENSKGGRKKDAQEK